MGWVLRGSEGSGVTAPLSTASPDVSRLRVLRLETLSDWTPNEQGPIENMQRLSVMCEMRHVVGTIHEDAAIHDFLVGCEREARTEHRNSCLSPFLNKFK